MSQPTSGTKSQALILHFFDEHVFAWKHQPGVVGYASPCHSRPWTVLHFSIEDMVADMLRPAGAI